MGRLQNVKSKLVNRAVQYETSFLVGFVSLTQGDQAKRQSF